MIKTSELFRCDTASKGIGSQRLKNNSPEGNQTHRDEVSHA